MAHKIQRFQFLICSLIIVAGPLFGGVKLHIEEGRPVVDGAYVNGYGPYRFLIDTGSNVNLIEPALARKISMNTSASPEFASAAAKVSVQQSDGNVISLAPIKADDQKFILTDLEAVHRMDPDIRGVLGQWFLSRFDYRLDLRTKSLEFGKQDANGTRVQFRWVNARPVISTSLGDLVLDSGAARLVLFNVKSEIGDRAVVNTLTGSRAVGIASRQLVIEGRSVWHGKAVTMASQTETDVAGLVPLNQFRAVYVSNSEGYVVFE